MTNPTYKLEVSALEYVDLDYIRRSHDVIKPHIVRTPIITNDYLSKSISKRVGHEVNFYLKLEPFQKTGSFKVRGALNAVQAAIDANNGNLAGVVTFSSGNHGASTAYAAMRLGVKSTIVVPKFTSDTKMANMKLYGAEVIVGESKPEEMDKIISSVVKDRGYTQIFPYNQKEVVAGQATSALELLEDYPEIDALLAPTGGGGLIAGTALAGKLINPDIAIFGAAPIGKNLRSALATQTTPDTWIPSKFIDTRCDALMAHPGSITFPIMCELMEKHTFDITDAEAASAMKMAWQKLKLTIELNSATAFAAVLSDEFVDVAREYKLKNVGIIVSGGNTSIEGPMPWTYLI